MFLKIFIAFIFLLILYIIIANLSPRLKPNLVVVTSVINISNKPLSYTNVRSFCDSNRRFEDTKKTIESIKKYIPNSKIIFIECSKLERYKEEYLKKNVDYYENYADDTEIMDKVNSSSKTLGEGTLTLKAFEYILKENIEYQNLFKISGRYWLNDDFDYEIYNNNQNIIKIKTEEQIHTCLYKLNRETVYKFNVFLNKFLQKCHDSMHYEVFFKKFILQNKPDFAFLDINLGISGYI